MDESEKIDLALSADFDSSLLSCWNDAGTEDNENSREGQSNLGSHSPRSQESSNASTSDLNWGGNTTHGFSRLPSFTMEDESSSQKSSSLNSREKNLHYTLTNQVGGTAEAEAAVAQHESLAVPKLAQVSAANSSLGSNSTKNPMEAPAPGPMPHITAQPTGTNIQHAAPQMQEVQRAAESGTRQLHPLAIPSSANCPPHVVTVASSAVGQTQLQHSAGAPMNGMSYLPLTIGNTNFANPAIPNMRNMTQISAQAATQIPGRLFFQQALPQAAVQQVAIAGGSLQNQRPASNQIQNQPQQQQQQQQQQHTQPQNQNISTTNANGTSITPPPFYLFDAPCELRTNFMQSQRMHGLPVTEDTNSYHYGIAVNGFHPQMSSQANCGAMPQVQLIDARTGGRKAGQIKNEREQRRAQKITELIDQLREKMETGGWKVEMKSKFHTLSSCADYVKHLVKITKEKEEAVQKARSDLERRERKVEEEKNSQQGSRSDPESVMSSLTSTSSTGDSANSSGQNGDSNKSSSPTVDSDKNQSRKRKGEEDTSDERGKKGRFLEHGDSSDSFSSERVVTESGSSSNKESSGDNKNSERSSDDDDDNSGDSGTPSSVSRDMVAGSSKDAIRETRETKHADVVIQGRNQQKKADEVTSLEKGFLLKYEEVFQHSNVPQIVATTAGKIIACNTFFLRALGVAKSGAKMYTIFSLVKAEKLSNLFEIVAEALRNDSSPLNVKEEGKAPEKVSPTEAKPNLHAIPKAKVLPTTRSLPCIDFPINKPKKEDCDVMPEGLRHLFVTVTLLPHEDPGKRLLHCIFTDSPGKNGGAGSLSPDLLAYLMRKT